MYVDVVLILLKSMYLITVCTLSKLISRRLAAVYCLLGGGMRIIFTWRAYYHLYGSVTLQDYGLFNQCCVMLP